MAKPMKKAAWERAAGDWDRVYAILAPELKEAMDRPGRHTWCPVHKGENGDAFRLQSDWKQTGRGVCNTCGNFPNGILLLAWLKGWSNAEAAAAVEEALNGSEMEYTEPARRVIEGADDEVARKDEFAMKCLVETWEATVGLGHPDAEPVLRYFDQRALTPMEGPLADLRCHPNLGYWDRGKCIGHFPALVTLVRQPNGEVATLHRIYLTPEGHKAPVGEAKKLMPRPSCVSLTGAAARLDPSEGPILHTAEGIETALAVRNITGEPTWAGISSTILPNIEPPPWVRAVCIWADRDPTRGQAGSAGRNAAERALENLEKRGLRAAVMMPPAIRHPSETVDWNDVVQRFDAQTIRDWPAYHQLRKVLDGGRKWRTR